MVGELTGCEIFFGVHTAFTETISFAFSLAWNTLADRRSRLSPELVDGLMFLHGLKKTENL